MKEIIEKMINHPIATLVIIGTVTGGIADIIRAARGVPVSPGITINTSKTDE